MSLLLAAAVAGAGAIIGSAVSAWSQQRTNESQERLQNATNDTSIELANTAHQREIADLKAAGLNPVLSAGGSGAATPTLGTAQVQNPMPNMGELAVQTANAMSTAKQTQATSALNKTQAEKTAVETAYTPQLAKAEIAKNLAEAKQATSVKQYNDIMGQVNQMVGDAQTEKALAEAGLIKKDTKGRITFNAINAGANALNGVANVMGATKGMGFNPMTINSNSARSYNYNYGNFTLQ